MSRYLLDLTFILYESHHIGESREPLLETNCKTKEDMTPFVAQPEKVIQLPCQCNHPKGYVSGLKEPQ